MATLADEASLDTWRQWSFQWEGAEPGNHTITVRATDGDGEVQTDEVVAPIPDGAVETACQGACPTRAITFGNVADPGSQVSAARKDTREYALLGHLNTRPRTTYLARVAEDEA